MKRVSAWKKTKQQKKQKHRSLNSDRHRRLALTNQTTKVLPILATLEKESCAASGACFKDFLGVVGLQFFAFFFLQNFDWVFGGSRVGCFSLVYECRTGGWIGVKGRFFRVSGCDVGGKFVCDVYIFRIYS